MQHDRTNRGSGAAPQQRDDLHADIARDQMRATAIPGSYDRAAHFRRERFSLEQALEEPGRGAAARQHLTARVDNQHNLFTRAPITFVLQ